MYKFFLAILCSLSFFALHAEDSESDPFESSLADTYGLVSTLVAGSISAITGHLVETETDFVVAGPQPLTLSRLYSPGYNPDQLTDGVDEDGEGASSYRLHQKWEFNRPDKLYSWDLDKLRLKKSHGALLKYECASENKGTRVSAWNVSETKGLTNCGLHEISARTNLNNIAVYLDKKHLSATAIDGSGSISYFVCEKTTSKDWRDGKKKNHYSSRCLFEKRPNGNLIFFNPTSFYATNPSESVEYARIHIDYQPRGKDFEIKASDGKQAIYKFKNYPIEIELEIDNGEERELKTVTKKRYVLSEVVYTHKPFVKYEYDAPFAPHNKGLYLTRISRPDDRFEAFKYSARSLIFQREAPVGCDKSPIVTHKMIYHRKKTHFPDGTYDIRGELQGYTEVFDAKQHKTVFVYNREKRPLSVLHYTGDSAYQLYSSEEYVWDDEYMFAKAKPKAHLFSRMTPPIPDFIIPSISPSRRIINPPEKPAEEEKEEELPPVPDDGDNGKGFTTAPKHRKIPPEVDEYLKRGPMSHAAFVGRRPQAGNLVGKYLKSADGSIYYARFFDYDSQGNILADTFYGNLTGSNTQPIVLNAEKKVVSNGVESYSNHFTYSQDHLNLLLSEMHGNGKEIRYTYVPGTDLISSKCLLDRGSLILRELREYDENTTLIKTTKESGNLECRITYFYPRKSAPFGLPEVIEEKYEERGQEILLKRTVCHYNKEGYLTKQDIFDSQGSYSYSLEWQHDAHGHVIQEVDALGQLVCRRYDDSGNLVWEQGPSTTYETTYTYDHSNRLIQTKRTQSDGKEFVTSYRYDYLSNCKAMIDRLGHKTRYVYDDLGRLIKTIYPKTEDENGQLSHPTVQTQYDIAGNPIAITNERGYTTSKSYNSRGKPLQVCYPDGTIERFEYRLDGALAKSVAKSGAVTLYTRDSLGRVLVEEVYSSQGELLTRQTYTYNGLHLVSSIDPEGRVTKHRYDGAGRLICTISKGHTTIFEYDTLGRLKKKRQLIGRREERCEVYEYDLLGRLTEESIEDGQGQVLIKTGYEYDEIGNRTKTAQETEAGLSISQAIYNADQKPICLINAEGDETHITYDFGYRSRCGQTVLSVTTCDAQGKSRIQIYDTLGRVIQQQRRNAFGALTFDQEIYYDLCGNQAKVVDRVLIDGKEQRQLIAAWAYNAVGQEICLTEALGLKEQRLTHTFYNSCGQKERILQPNGVAILYTYDALGRLKTLSSSDQTVSYLYTYNKNHQVICVEDHVLGQKTHLMYDRSGRLKREMLGSGLTLQYQYDNLDRPICVQLPDHSQVKYVYDAGFLRQVRRMQKGQELYSHTFQRYDLAGHLLQAKLIGEGEEAHYSWDLCCRPKEIKTQAWEQVIPKGGYDSIGRLTAFTIQDKAGRTDCQFAYDDLDQLALEKGHVQHEYKSDSVSNRLTKDDKAYSINALHQLTAQGHCQYTYDFNGNLSEKKREDQTIQYTYDALNRLIAVKQEGVLTTYTYDSFNRRLSKKQGDLEWKYLYQGQNEVGCFCGGKIEELRLLGCGIEAEIGAAVAIELRGEVYAPVHDHNGNVSCLLGLDGKAAETYRYSAFGEEQIFDHDGQRVASSLVKNPWRYASKRVDEESGFIYFGRRYYDPEIGRWITTDPSGLADGPNLYAYLHHSPLTYHDAYGLQSEEYFQEGCEVVSFDASCLNESEDRISNEYCNYTESAPESSNHFQLEVYQELSLTEKIKKTAEWIVRSCVEKIQAGGRASHIENMYASCEPLRQINSSACVAAIPYSAPAGIIKHIRDMYGATKTAHNIYNRCVKGESSLEVEIREFRPYNGISLEKPPFDMNDLSRAGQVMDRSGLTRAGRALDKHGGRVDSFFPKATGNPQSKNAQGQFHLEDILTHPKTCWERGKNYYEGYVPDGRGARFTSDGDFIGFVERRGI